MPKIRLRYLTAEKSRHDKLYLYFRRPGRRKIRLLVSGYDDPHFAEAYSAAMSGEQWRPPTKAPSGNRLDKSTPGSFRATCEQYFAYLCNDPELTERTKYLRRRHLEWVCQQPTKPDAPYLMGDVPISKFGPSHIFALRDRKIKTPEAANNVLKAISVVFKWAVQRQLVADNPATKVPKFKTHSEGFKAWSLDDVEKFVSRHPIGTKAHLAMALLLFTGQRRSDVILFGRQHVKGDELHFVQQKNQKRSPKKMAIYIMPALERVLSTVPRDQMTYLVTEYGKPFTATGFGNWFRDRCDEAGLKGLSAHGLRKTLQIAGAESGLSQHELMAIAGHESPKMTALYTKDRDRQVLARSGLLKLSEGPLGNEFVQPSNPDKKGWTNQQ